MFHVKQRVAVHLFHVKQPADKMNEEILLTYTKLAEDNVENILNIDAPQQPSQRMRRCPELFRGEFLTSSDHLYAAMQRNRRLLQQLPLPGPADQPTLTGAEIILGEPDQSRDQLRKPIAAAGRNSKAGFRPPMCPRLPHRVEIDLVPNHPDRRGALVLNPVIRC